jgi:ATP-dependent RNA helicase DDX42
MMQNFKSSFVSASSSVPSNSTPSRGTSSFVKPALRGFVSGGTIGGGPPAPSFVPASRPAGNNNENGNSNPERYVAHDTWTQNHVILAGLYVSI